MRQALVGVQQTQAEHGTRLDQIEAEHGQRLDRLEGHWKWLTDTLGRLLNRLGDVSEKTTVILQRYDQLVEKIDELACSPLRERK